MKKNITLIGVNYYPEDSAIGLYTTQKAEYLSKEGYNVSVVTGFPYYPQWIIPKEYIAKKAYINETINEIKVFRFKQYVPSSPSFFKRIIHLSSFTFGSIPNLFKIPKPDIVICIIPFTSTVVLGWLLKIKFKCKLWVHIQDFEFDAAIDSGLLSKKSTFVIKPLLWFEKTLLKKADIISTISKGMMSKLNSKLKNKTYCLTNWIDPSVSTEMTNENHEYLRSNNFKILYSGNIGAKQNWDFFFQFLEKLKEVKNIEVIVVGEGAEKERVINRISKYKFVKHYDLVPYQEVSILLSSADLHILFQKDDIIDTVMPSKILGMMASGKPSIITGNIKSEVKQIIDECEGGFYFQNNQINDIIEVIRKLKKNKDQRLQIGANAKQYVIEKYSKNKVLEDFSVQVKKLF